MIEVEGLSLGIQALELGRSRTARVRGLMKRGLLLGGRLGAGGWFGTVWKLDWG